MPGTTTAKRRPAGFVEALLLDLLGRASRPLSANALAERARRHGIHVYSSQVFRGLDRLCRRQLAHRVELAGGYVAGDSRRAAMVCESCGSFRQLDAESAFAELDDVARAKGFSIARYVVEVPGLCERCAGR
jgi:Fur family zinc uptake transcriptional regulator